MMNKSLSEEKVPQILLLDFHQKMGGGDLPDWVEMCGDRESDRNLGFPLDILFGEQGKDCDKKNMSVGRL